jgi:hypothetical protein
MVQDACLGPAADLKNHRLIEKETLAIEVLYKNSEKNSVESYVITCTNC